MSVHESMRMRSEVSGNSIGKNSGLPAARLAALMASQMAKAADDARMSGGSPMALEE